MRATAIPGGAEAANRRSDLFENRRRLIDERAGVCSKAIRIQLLRNTAGAALPKAIYDGKGMTSTGTSNNGQKPTPRLKPEDLRTQALLYPPRRKKKKKETIREFVQQHYPKNAVDGLLRALGRKHDSKILHDKVKRILERFCLKYYYVSRYADAKHDLEELKILQSQLSAFNKRPRSLTKRQHDLISLGLWSVEQRQADAAHSSPSGSNLPSAASNFKNILAITRSIHKNVPLSSAALESRHETDILDIKSGENVKPYEHWRAPMSALLEHFHEELAAAVKIALARVERLKGRRGKGGNPENMARQALVRRLLKLSRSDGHEPGQTTLRKHAEQIVAPLLPKNEAEELNLDYEARVALAAVKSKSR